MSLRNLTARSGHRNALLDRLEAAPPVAPRTSFVDDLIDATIGLVRA